MTTELNDAPNQHDVNRGMGQDLTQQYLVAVPDPLMKKITLSSSTYLELLGEGVGGVQLHDVLHKLLHGQRLVTVCSQRRRT